MRSKIGGMAAFLVFGGACCAAHLSCSTKRAFEAYVESVETRLRKQHADRENYAAVLNVDAAERTQVLRDLRAGGLRVEPVKGGTRQISGGLLHHWQAAAVVPGGTPAAMLALLRDYGELPRYYAPDVERSRVLSDNGGAATIALRLRKQTVVVKLVFDSEYEVRSALDGPNRGYSWSRSTHIWQIDRAGTLHERRRGEGEDDGFLWRLNSYWTFIAVPGGLLVECEAVSLTREMPIGLGWLITPIASDLPRRSLEFTLTATRRALTEKAVKGAEQ